MTLTNKPTMKQPSRRKLLSDLLHGEHILTNCVNCDFFDQDKEVCKIAGNERPPAKVIVRGCDAWRMLIPF